MYEPIETPIGTNPLHPNVVSNPTVRILESDKGVELRSMPEVSSLMSVQLTRLTEHFHFWTKQSNLNMIA